MTLYNTPPGGGNQKLLFLDLDGTLIYPGTYEMPASAERALQEARRQGHRAIVCTGRHYGAIKPLLHHGFDGVIASAGGYITAGEQVLRDEPIPDADRDEAFRLLRENGICIHPETFDNLYIDETVYSLLNRISGQAGNSELARLRKQADDRLGNVPLSGYHGETVYKILFLCESESQLTIPEKALSDRFFFLKHPRDGNGLLNGELIWKANSKGKALELVTAYFGLTVADTIAFGDSLNDWEMFRSAGYRVCMGNGAEELKRAADYVCPPQNEDGLYQAFAHLQLLTR